MSRNYHPKEILKMTRAKRDLALKRHELRMASDERTSAAGATSFPLKAPDADVARMVAEFEAKKASGGGQ